jgi:hypothetical protein
MLQVVRLIERMTRFYEQGADSLRIGQYVSKWIGWVAAGHGIDIIICNALRAQHTTRLRQILLSVSSTYACKA